MTATPHWIDFKTVAARKGGEPVEGIHRVHLKCPIPARAGDARFDATLYRARRATLTRLGVHRFAAGASTTAIDWSASIEVATTPPETPAMTRTPEALVLAARIQADTTRAANLARDDHYLAAAKVLEALARELRDHGVKLGQIELHNPPARKPTPLPRLKEMFDRDNIHVFYAGWTEVKDYFNRYPLATTDDLVTHAFGEAGGIFRQMAAALAPIGRNYRMDVIIAMVQGHIGDPHYARAAGMAAKAFIRERGR